MTPEQIKVLTNILVKYFNGQASIAAEAGTIQELIKTINTPAPKPEEPKPEEPKPEVKKK